MSDLSLPFVTISEGWRNPAADNDASSADSTYGSSLGDPKTPPATHDISRVNYHVKCLPDFARALEDSASRAFPNRGSSARYQHVYALLLHWDSDDLFVLPELEDLEACFSQDYNFETERFKIPSDNAHLDLMLKIGSMIKEHESNDTLLIVYYGGHARIDESRQSTWCATRDSGSPWLQWSAIQTLLERSLSDALILLDCCAGAASAAFPNGNSITETISASSWDAIAPNPGRYSFTSSLIEVLQEWKRKTFSACMLHAEILARLKHPRLERRNGNQLVETRTTPVHFMMTANHRAPSIELCKTESFDMSPSLPFPHSPPGRALGEGRASPDDIIGSEPNENVPHVMVSLALEDNQTLNIEDWEQWLSNIPALAKYVKVQGVFKSHSTLLLLSLPVMVWDMLPDHKACNFIAFIRSNNLASEEQWKLPLESSADYSSGAPVESDRRSILSGTTAYTDYFDSPAAANWSAMGSIQGNIERPTSLILPEDVMELKHSSESHNKRGWQNPASPALAPADANPSFAMHKQASSLGIIQNRHLAAHTRPSGPSSIAREKSVSRPALAPHVQKRLDEYFLSNPWPTVAVKEFLASNLGIQTADIDRWFQQRRDQQEVYNKLQSLRMEDQNNDPASKDGSRMILPGHLNELLEMFPTMGQIVVIDLRPRGDYQRSHIHSAINFRAPASFVSRATIEMIEKALTDDASRSSFNKWYTSKCVVFYDKVIEYPWEAPVADAFFQKFKSKAWPGQCFVLKGHYREFSQSFDKYIVGAATTGKSAEYLASLQDVSWDKRKDHQQRYEEWLKLLDDEDRVHTIELAPATKAERLQATVKQQKTLEVDFERAMPHLYRQAQARKPDDNWSIKAPMVSHVERGLAKMQRERQSGPSKKEVSDKNRDLPAYSRYPPTATKDYAEDKYALHHSQSLPQQAPGRSLHKSTSSGALAGSGSSDDSGSAGDHRRGRGASAAAVTGGKNLFTKLIRSGRMDAPSGR
ncbi:hypothetical protein F5Y16DRAFT_398957 [Xylariaceae sp. FL0255]|nr:hypothetical protein F5Y16DRAFT_398957 [Xylariaceae sp. FL0255]